MPLNVARNHDQQVSPIQRNMFSMQQYRQSPEPQQLPLVSPVPHQYIQSRYVNVPSNEDDHS